jgi:hypothetical protein
MLVAVRTSVARWGRAAYVVVRSLQITAIAEGGDITYVMVWGSSAVHQRFHQRFGGPYRHTLLRCHMGFGGAPARACCQHFPLFVDLAHFGVGRWTCSCLLSLDI